MDSLRVRILKSTGVVFIIFGVTAMLVSLAGLTYVEKLIPVIALTIAGAVQAAVGVVAFEYCNSNDLQTALLLLILAIVVVAVYIGAILTNYVDVSPYELAVLGVVGIVLPIGLIKGAYLIIKEKKEEKSKKK